jgi:uncharacterized paraquat-inducible protein A
MKKRLGLVLLVLSIGLLIPGITFPMVKIAAFIDFMGFKKNLMEESRSILETVEILWQGQNYLVAVLIFGFSVVIPVVKIILLGFASYTKRDSIRTKLWVIVNGIAKWSMADVFVVGIFVAYLSAQATDNMTGELEKGFYYFTGYCIINIIASQLLKPKTE